MRKFSAAMAVLAASGAVVACGSTDAKIAAPVSDGAHAVERAIVTTGQPRISAIPGIAAFAKLTAEQMIRRAEELERFAEGCRREGIVQGPEGAEDAEAAARDWRWAADRERGGWRHD